MIKVLITTVSGKRLQNRIGKYFFEASSVPVVRIVEFADVTTAAAAAKAINDKEESGYLQHAVVLG